MYLQQQQNMQLLFEKQRFALQSGCFDFYIYTYMLYVDFYWYDFKVAK